MKNGLLILTLSLFLMIPSTAFAGDGLPRSFSEDFDRLFLSKEPVLYCDNFRLLREVPESEGLSKAERDLLRQKLKTFLLASQSQERASSRDYVFTSDCTPPGVASPIAFLRLESVSLLGRVGEKGDIPFIESLDQGPDNGFNHPFFKDECRKAIENIRLSPEEELSLLRKKISDMGNRCTPQKGTSKEEVERVFGAGEESMFDTFPSRPEGSAYYIYNFCKDGILHVVYLNDLAWRAHFEDYFTVQQREKRPPIEELIREARGRLRQMEIIYSAYLERIQDLSLAQSLALTIQCDKKAYDFNEEITFWLTLKNLSSQTIQDVPRLLWSSRIIFDGEEYTRPHGKDWSAPPWSGPAKIRPNAEIGFGLGLSDYEVPKDKLTAGQHHMAVKIKGITSNTITVEVAGKTEKKNQPLALTIQSDKPVYEAGEPILIKYSLKNNAPESMKILAYGGNFGFQFGNPFSVKDSKDNILLYTGLMKQRPEPTEEDYVTMKPGDILENEYRLDLFYDMTKPSTYSVGCNEWQLDMLSDTGIASNTIQIEVVDNGLSLDIDKVRADFAALKKKWEIEEEQNRHRSDDVSYWQGEAGQAILAMGKKALPFVMEEIKQGNLLYNWAAWQITGIRMNGKPSGSAQDVSQNWIRWWEENKNHSEWNIFISQAVKEKKDLTGEEAMDMAQQALGNLTKDAERYYFKDIREIKRDERDIWFATFDLKEKLKQMRDKRAQTAGGEVFISIDKKTGEVSVGYGD
ncbi:MAG: hypothetical protein ABIJ41_07775 [Candidatus Omnitrophota bacterium]